MMLSTTATMAACKPAGQLAKRSAASCFHCNSRADAPSAITGHAPPNPEAPWFWSDQYDLKLQIAGLPFGADSRVIRGDPAAAKFAIFHLKGDQVQAVEAVNAPPEFMMGKMLILNRKPVSRERLADSSISMKEVAA